MLSGMANVRYKTMICKHFEQSFYLNKLSNYDNLSPKIKRTEHIKWVNYLFVEYSIHGIQ